MSKRGGLGRGLSALIPGAPEAGEGFAGLLEVPVNAVSPNPKQPRTHWDEEEIASLAASIREVGILQPIVVRKSGERYELVAGERRLRAAKVAGLATVPVVLRDTGDADLLREALIENIHREDLGPIELAEAFRQLLEELGLKQEELAERVGVSRSHIANTIRLLQLPSGFPAVARATARSRPATPEPCCRWATPRPSMPSPCGWRPRTSRSARPRSSSAATWTGLRRRKRSRPPPADATPQVGMAEVEEILSEQLATRVQIQMNKKRGRVIIEFGSADDLERIVSEIVGSGPGLSPD